MRRLEMQKLRTALMPLPPYAIDARFRRRYAAVARIRVIARAASAEAATMLTRLHGDARQRRLVRAQT